MAIEGGSREDLKESRGRVRVRERERPRECEEKIGLDSKGLILELVEFEKEELNELKRRPLREGRGGGRAR